MNRIIASLVFLFASSLALAQSYPSRPTFLSAGVGCNPNSYANDNLNPGEIGFLCIGRYPYTLGTQPGTIYLIEPTAQSAASLVVFEDSQGNAGLSLYDGVGSNHLTLNGDGDSSVLTGEWFLGATSTLGGFLHQKPSGAEPAWLRIHSGSGNPGFDDFRVAFTAPNTSVHAPLISGTSLDDSGVASMHLGSFDLQNETVSDLFMTADFLQSSTGQFFAVEFEIGGNAAYRLEDDSFCVTMTGTPDFCVTEGVIDTLDSTIVDSDDNNVNFGNDVSIVGDLNVTGSITGAGVVLGGYSDSAATGEIVPSGWSIALAGTTYTVTHSLALGTPLSLAVSCTSHVLGSHASCQLGNFGANSFDVLQFNDENGTINAAFSFTATVVN